VGLYAASEAQWNEFVADADCRERSPAIKSKRTSPEPVAAPGPNQLGCTTCAQRLGVVLGAKTRRCSGRRLRRLYRDGAGADAGSVSLAPATAAAQPQAGFACVLVKQP